MSSWFHKRRRACGCTFPFLLCRCELSGRRLLLNYGAVTLIVRHHQGELLIAEKKRSTLVFFCSKTWKEWVSHFRCRDFQLRCKPLNCAWGIVGDALLCGPACCSLKHNVTPAGTDWPPEQWELSWWAGRERQQRRTQPAPVCPVVTTLPPGTAPPSACHVELTPDWSLAHSMSSF